MKMIRLCRIIWILFLYTAFYLCTDVLSLKCLQCKSFKNQEDCYRGVSKPEECPKENHTYCITYSGYLKDNGVHLIYRDCSQLNLTSECQSMLVKNPISTGPEQDFRYCAHTCDTDGCNRDLHTPNTAPSLMNGCCTDASPLRSAALLVNLMLSCYAVFRNVYF